LAELGVFQAIAGQHGDEPSARAIDMVHVLSRTKFRMGNILPRITRRFASTIAFIRAPGRWRLYLLVVQTAASP
jgi:hypothetical protein